MSDALRTVAELMCVAAHTAPKTHGDNYIVTAIVEGEACQRLGEAMIQDKDSPHWDIMERDGKNVKMTQLVVLIGIKDAKVAGANCGACGSGKCVRINTYEGLARGPQCAFRVLDMGIALGSAAKVASLMNADNRLMATVGLTARRLGMIDADYAIGIPLSATGKNIFFDRKS